MYNLYFEQAAIIILTTLAVALMIRRVARERTNTLFLALICAVLLTAVVDVAEARVDNIRLRYVLNYIYFILRNGTPPLFVLYISSYMGIWHRLRGLRPLSLLTVIPYAVDLAIIFSNPVTRGVFCIDPDGTYHRGGLIYILYGIAFYYIVLCMAALIKNRRLMDFRRYIILLMFEPFNAFAVLIQMQMPYLRIEVFGTAVLAVLIAVGVQRPEEYIDSAVGINAGAGFIKDIRKTLDAGRSATVVLFKYTNHRTLRDTLGFELYTKLNRKLADKLVHINSLTASKATLYYLDRGTFAAITSYSRYNMIYNLGRMLTDYIRTPIKLGIMEVELDSRVCLINCPGDISDADSFLSFANQLEYRIPADDKLVIMSDVSESKDFKMRNEMNAIINRGIEGHNFQMYYQPIYSIEKGRFTSAEALIRLIDDEYGFVSPALFIPVAEEIGAIHHIGDYVIDEVCRFIASDTYKSMGLEYIEINVSVAQCIEADLPKKFEDTLRKYGVKTSQINLEITETAVDYDPAVTDRNIAKLSELGFSFSLDDYGTGYSNIKRVVTLPLDIVKLDKCLVDDMDNESMWIMIKNTVKMLKSMDKKILVEGVEEERALDKFKALGCDYIQGFYFSKPLPEREFVRFIRRSEEKKE